MGAALWSVAPVLPFGLNQCFGTGKATWFAFHKTFICDTTCFDWTASAGVAVMLWGDYRTVGY